MCAVISGAESWVEVEQWGQVKADWLTDWLGLAHGIPSQDTFGRVFRRIDPDQFETGFLRWVHALAVHAPREVIALESHPPLTCAADRCDILREVTVIVVVGTKNIRSHGVRPRHGAVPHGVPVPGTREQVEHITHAAFQYADAIGRAL